jgi:NAD+ synthase (glutamine-hydrolysing)
MVLGTGDLSELLIGWCTMFGDHASHYGINAGVPKTLITYLIRWSSDVIFAKEAEVQAVLTDILATEISPELLPPDARGNIAQKTEELVGPYELVDFFGYYLVRWGYDPSRIARLAQHAFDGKYDLATIKKWLNMFLQRFFGSQFKRSCLPDGPKVGMMSISPRGDWRMPSDAEVQAWLDELEANVP